MLPLNRSRSRSRFFPVGVPSAPTDPFWSDVSLLLNTTSTNGAQNNTFLDSSTNAFSVTRNGNTTQGTFSPFPPSAGAAWSASTNGGSGYFDGAGDSLTLASNAAFAYGTGDFTWEAWIYPTSNTGYVLDHGANGGTIFYNGTRLVYYNPTTGIGGSLYTVGFANNPPLNTWHHIAAVRNGGTTYLYFNGVLSTSAADANNYASQAVYVGQYGLGANNYLGYISNLRLVKGTAVYTANFTPPTAPLTAITNTSLLLNFTNAGIFDSASGNDLETVGNAQVSTVQSKWGTTSMAFDGTGDYLAIPNRPAFAFGTGNFTIEMWVYLPVLPSSGAPGLIDFRPFFTNGAYPALFIDSATKTLLYFTNSISAIVGTTTLAASTWYHVALSRSGTSTMLFLNGVQEGSTYTDTASYLVGAGRPLIGTNAYSPSTGNLNGYIDDLRITTGYARYTANFTPPTAAFPDQ